jgi:hypothetical protein
MTSFNEWLEQKDKSFFKEIFDKPVEAKPVEAKPSRNWFNWSSAKTKEEPANAPLFVLNNFSKQPDPKILEVEYNTISLTPEGRKYFSYDRSDDKQLISSSDMIGKSFHEALQKGLNINGFVNIEKLKETIERLDKRASLAINLFISKIIKQYGIKASGDGNILYNDDGLNWIKKNSPNLLRKIAEANPEEYQSKLNAAYSIKQRNIDYERSKNKQISNNQFRRTRPSEAVPFGETEAEKNMRLRKEKMAQKMQDRNREEEKLQRMRNDAGDYDALMT